MKKINYVRLYKETWLLCELTSFEGRNRTGSFTVDYEKSPLEQYFVTKKIKKSCKKCFKEWKEFLKWMVIRKIENTNEIKKDLNGGGK